MPRIHPLGSIDMSCRNSVSQLAGQEGQQRLLEVCLIYALWFRAGSEQRRSNVKLKSNVAKNDLGKRDVMVQLRMTGYTISYETRS